MTQTILIIDDEADIRSVLSDIFTDEGFQTLKAAHSEQALALLQQNHVDLIILDIWLENSDMDGIEILQYLKKQDDYKTIPTLMISGHGNIELAVKAMKIGAFDFIEKPFKIDHILATVERALSKDASPSAGAQRSEPSLIQKDNTYCLAVIQTIIEDFEKKHGGALYHPTDNDKAVWSVQPWSYGLCQLQIAVEWYLMTGQNITDQADHNEPKMTPQKGSLKGHIDPSDMPLKEAREAFEIEYLTCMLDQCEGNISLMANKIDMERTALYRKLKTLNIHYQDKKVQAS